jgi:bacteriocin-like protein
MRELDEKELKQVSGGAITQTNNGGQEPNGNANGIPSTNPAGHEPPGQNKKETGNPNA